MHNFDLVLNNASLILPQGPQTGSVGVENGKIARISQTELSGKESIDCRGLTVLPGVIDSQVHFREPGMTQKEDLESGSRAAALGGVTSFFEMPNTLPATTTLELLEEKLNRAKGRSWVNYAFYIGAAAENIAQLARLESHPGCAGIKVFMGSSTGTLLVDSQKQLEEILRGSHRRIIVHSEDEARLKARKHIALDSKDVAQHHIWRDVESALISTKILLDLARKTGRKVHVLHVSTSEEMDLLKSNKDIATVEVLPNHLSLSAPECYIELGSRAQQNPPIREIRHQNALWNALRDGIVDVIGSDHAPHTLEEKARPYPESPSGTPGVQTLVPIMLDHVHQGRLSLGKFVELVCENPRKVFGCTSKGRIELGLDGDFSIVDLKRTETITNAWITSRSAWTPFDGKKVTGWPVGTIVGGKVVMRDGELLGSPQGKMVTFEV